MPEKAEASLIQVEIFGKTYNVRGEEDKAYIEELARYVDTKMKAISESTGTIDSLKVAILAALNIADEYFKLEQKHQDAQEQVAKRASELVSVLGEALEEGPADHDEPAEKFP